jgi:hypothetical protein
VIQREAPYVGKSLYGGCPSFGGKIGEIIAYNRELADDEVQLVPKQAIAEGYASPA